LPESGGSRALARAVWVVAAACLSAPALSAQETVQQAAAPADGRQVFEAGYFGAYNPVTAFDMVSRVPGFEIDDGESRRGFGATAGNVLVNGERPSSKTTISDQLKRIPAGSVIRVELISGSSSNSDVRGQTQLVNVVVRKATVADSPTTFVLAARHIQYSDRIGWTAQVSRSIPLGDDAELALDFQVPNLRGRTEGFEAVRNGAGVLTEVRDAYGQPNNIGLQGSAVLKWRPTARDNINLNVQVGPTWNTTGNASYDFRPNGALARALTGRSEYENNYSGEFGADWEHRFSDTLSAKAIGLISTSNVDQSDEFRIFFPPGTSVVREQQRQTEGGERVGRVALTWLPAAGHTLEFGGEVAYNFRDTALDIQQSLNGGPAVDVPLAISDTLVEELRGEAFVTEVWNVTKALTLEAGFTFEASRITQSGDEAKEREFTYPKPRLVGTYALPNGDQLRASIERDVSQLDFSEFASSVNVIDNSSLRGNPNLKPEQTWKSRIEWEHRFGKRGALTLAAFHNAIEDVRDFVAIDAAGNLVTGSATPPNVGDGIGNIGDGTRTGVEVRGTLPLSFIGLNTAELRFSGLVQESEVTDPWTGEKRAISINSERTGSPSGAAVLNGGDKDWAYIISYRHELPSLSSAWGSNLLQWSAREEYRYDEIIEYERPDPRLEFFYETTAIKPFTVRFFLNNIFSPPETRVWTFYTANRAVGAVREVWTRKNKGGPEGTRSFGVQVSGRF
jgi:hypothetical protein